MISNPDYDEDDDNDDDDGYHQYFLKLALLKFRITVSVHDVLRQIGT